MGNPFVHVELMTTDADKAKSFYGELFDWELEDMSMGAWMAYVLVDDLKAATRKAKSLGGTVMKDETEVPGMGSFSIITDPTGAMLGLWEPKKA
jgi:predicted enzyme related to lactoylglutathione lyase